METVTDFILGDSKITTDGDCNHEIKICLLLGRKAMTNLNSILKSRDIILPEKVHLVKALVFLVVMCGCDSWTIKKVEHQRIDAFELWCWRRLLRAPWTARRSNQEILNEISSEYSLEELTHWKRPWCWERLRAEVKGMKENEMPSWHHRFSGRVFEQTLGNSEGQGRLARCSSWGWTQPHESDTNNPLTNNNTAQ